MLEDRHSSYEAALKTAERIAFRLDDVLPEGATLDFSRPFLPESLARSGELGFLSASEQRTLNQIRAHAYLRLFGLVEEFILPFVLDHARSALGQGDQRTRALLQFAGEEAKHIALFKRFSDAFERGFGSRCEAVGPAAAVADKVLSHAPLGVALAILHIEWMTQRHYVESVKRDQQLEPLFKSLLKQHFSEECQHAKLDTLIALELAESLDDAAVLASVDDYFAIADALDQLLVAQVGLDLASFERACQRTLTFEQRTAFCASQLRACRFTYLGAGMSHPSFVATVAELCPGALPRLEMRAARYV